MDTSDTLDAITSTGMELLAEAAQLNRSCQLDEVLAVRWEALAILAGHDSDYDECASSAVHSLLGSEDAESGWLIDAIEDAVLAVHVHADLHPDSVAVLAWPWLSVFGTLSALPCRHGA